jgi:hypothetical protein
MRQTIYAVHLSSLNGLPLPVCAAGRPHCQHRKGSFYFSTLGISLFSHPAWQAVFGIQKGAPQRHKGRCGVALPAFAPDAYRAAGLFFGCKGLEIHSRKLFVDAL